jgi:hypothetical protein
MSLQAQQEQIEIEMNCHVREIWYSLYRIIMEACGQSSYIVKKKTSMSSHLSRRILTSTLFYFVIAIWIIAGYTVKGAYATSTLRSESNLPFPLPLHGDTINKHQVRCLYIVMLTYCIDNHIILYNKYI